MSGRTPYDDEIAAFRRTAAAGSLAAADALAGLLRERYLLAGDPADLAEGHRVVRTAADSLPEDHPVRAVLLHNLGGILRDRYQLTGDVAFLYEALAAVPGDGRSLPAPMAMNRVETLRLLTERNDDPGPLAEAETIARSVLAGLAEGDPIVAAVRESLADVNRLRYVRTHELPALTEAVDLLAAALRDTAADDPRRAPRLNGLGDLLQMVALHTGDEDTREEAIRLLRTALEVNPFDTDRPYFLTDLAVALCDRGRHTDDLAALREGVGLLRTALEMTPPEHGSWANRCENFLVSAEGLAARTGDVPLMNEMIDVGRAAVERGGQESAIALLVAAVLRQRSEHTGRTDDLDTALAGLEKVRIPYGHANHIALLGNQGQLWLARYRAGGDPGDLRQAVSALGAAVRASPPGLPLRAHCLMGYGDALWLRYLSSGDPAVGRAAGAAYREAAHVTGNRPRARAEAARAWGVTEAAAGRWQAAHEAYALAVRLLPLAVSRRLARGDQEYGLGRLDGLAADAAACALHAGDPENALRLLELARGVLLRQATQGRDDLAELAISAPRLAAEIAALIERLGPAGPLTGAAADQRHDLDLRLRGLLDEARALPGFAGLFGPPASADLYRCAEAGPIVVLNVSRYRSDALIVRPSGVQVVELPALTPAKVDERSAALAAALEAAAAPGPGERQAQTTVAEVLGWLAETVADPVLDHLTDLGPGSRIWWSPVGALAFLPVHAAAADRVVSSYTPTLRALHRAASRPSSPGPTLVIAMAETPGLSALPGADREARAVADLTSSTVLSGEQATYAAVRDALTRHSNVHFACHAAADPGDPSAGRLLLQDRPLTVREIAALDLPQAYLAVLSACETALGAPHLPDEALHLVSAFQLAGFPEVVGTLWPINDRVARDIAVDLYRGLADGEDAARALHRAVGRCRARYPGTPTLWAAHVHSGR